MNSRIWLVGLVCWLFLGVTSESLAQPINKPADWDVAKIRADGDRFLFESIPKSNFKRPVIEHAVTSKTFPLQLEDISDNEILSLCDYRADLRQRGEKITECPRVSDVFEVFKGKKEKGSGVFVSGSFRPSSWP